MRTKRCLTCGTLFKAIRNDAKYCKPYHRLIAFRKRDELIVARADRRLRDTLGGVQSGRLTGAQARAELALYMLDGIKVPREVKDLIRNL